MKTRWMVLACGLAAWMVVAALAGERRNWRERMVRQRLDRLADKVALTDEQIEKVRDLYNDSFEKMREAWRNRGDRSVDAMRALQDRSSQIVRGKIVALLEPDQVNLFAEQLAEQTMERAAAIVEAVRGQLGLTDDAWQKLEPELKKLARLKAQLSAKLDVARAQLRELLDKRGDDAQAIARKLKELETIKRDLTPKIDELRDSIRKMITQNQWAQLIVEGVVE